MSKKNRITYLLVLMVCFWLVNLSFAKKPADQKQQTINLENRNQYLSRLRRNIEDFYEYELLAVTLRTEAEIQQLELVYNAPYIQLYEQNEIAQTVLEINNYNNFDFKPRKHRKLSTDRFLGHHFRSIRKNIHIEPRKVSAKRFAKIHSRITEIKSRILAKGHWQKLELEIQRKYALGKGLDRLSASIQSNDLQAKTVHVGRLSGIVYCEEKPLAIIGDRIVGEGDTVGKLRIVNIYPDTVVFSQNDKKMPYNVGDIIKISRR